MDTAVQFLATVCGSAAVLNGRLKDTPNVKSIHSYTLKSQIKEASRLGRDSGSYSKYYFLYHSPKCLGFLQILFLAGALQRPVQQHCNEIQQDLYKLLVPPCSCTNNYKSTLHIMWIRMSDESIGGPNHLIPLIANSSKLRFPHTV